MAFRVALLCLAVILGSSAFPVEDEQDMSMFFDHTDPSARIVGGSQAGIVPHMVGLTSGLIVRSFVCGASIISARTMLTAAHCIRAVGGSNLNNSLRGVVGTIRWNSGGVSYAFQRGVMHANYDHNNIKNDIGVLITSSNILMSSSIQRIAISSSFAGAGLNTRVTGWGRTVAGGSLSATLLELHLRVIDGNQCIADVNRVAAQLNMRVPPVNPNVEICTFIATGRGTCNGDSGSALVNTATGQQVGIVSWGLPCARGAPDMFVRVSAFQAWLAQNTV